MGDDRPHHRGVEGNRQVHGLGKVLPEKRRLRLVGQQERDRSGRRPVVGPVAGRQAMCAYRRSLVCGGEGGVVGEDAVLQTGELGAGFDTQSLDEMASGLFIGAQGVGLPATAIQRQHELSPQPFVQGVYTHQQFQSRDRLPGTIQVQEGVVAALQAWR